MKTRKPNSHNFDNSRDRFVLATNGETAVEATLPSAFRPSSEFYRVARKDTEPLVLNAAFIVAAAHANAGEHTISDRVRNLFFADSARAAKRSVLDATIGDIQENIRSGEAHDRERTQELHRTRRDRDEEGGKLLWRPSTRVLVTMMLLFAGFYLFAEIRNGMLFAKMSGIEELKSTIAALMLALAPSTAVGLFLKLLSFQFHNDESRWKYHSGVGAVGLVAALAAVPLFAKTYAIFLRDPVEAMTTSAGPAFSPALTIGVQILLCSIASAALLIFAFAIIERHRSPLKRDNPAWLKIKGDLDQISQVLRHDRELLSLAQGLLDALNAELSGLIIDATTAYRLERQSIQSGEQRIKDATEARNRMLPPHKK